MATITGKVKNSVTLQGQVTVPMGIVPRGNVDLTTNGVHNVTSYETATVDMLVPSGSMEITQNGTFDVTALAEVMVNIGGLEYETGEFTPNTNTFEMSVQYEKEHSTLPWVIAISAMDSGTPNDSNLAWVFINHTALAGSSGFGRTYYAHGVHIYTTYRGAPAYSTPRTVTNPPSTVGNTFEYFNYWVNQTGFTPKNSFSNRTMWTGGKSYKWIAIWASTNNV